MIMQQFYRGTSIRIGLIVRTTKVLATPALADPSNGCTITIEDPEGTSQVSAQAMTQLSTGKYYYEWQSNDSMPLGFYRCELVADDATFDTLTRLTAFELIA